MSSEKEEMTAFFKGHANPIVAADVGNPREGSMPDSNKIADVAQRASDEFDLEYPAPQEPSHRDGFYNYLLVASDGDIQATQDVVDGSVFLMLNEDGNCTAVVTTREDAEYYCKCGRATGYASRPLTKKVGRINTARKMFAKDRLGVREVPLDPETLLFRRGDIFFADSLVQAAAAIQLVTDNGKQWCDYYDATDLRKRERLAFIYAAVRKALGQPPAIYDAIPLYDAQRAG